jgi:hypothetical protein
VKLGKFEEQILYAEVDGICPLCTEPLHHKKNNNTHANYDKAHIYPLNPTPVETKILKDEPHLGIDINDIKNLILLCKKCHHKFDNPRTLDEYRELYKTKLALIQKSEIRGTYSMFGLEDEIRTVIQKLNIVDIDEVPELKLDVKKIDEKADPTMPKLLKKQIKNDVTDYFDFIKSIFIEIDKDTPCKFDTLATQIKAFYLKCKQTTPNQEIIYNGIVDWLYSKTEKYSKRACEIVVAYFIQDCEVF